MIYGLAEEEIGIVEGEEKPSKRLEPQKGGTVHFRVN